MSLPTSPSRAVRHRGSVARSRSRRRWLAFAVGALAALAGLAWVTRAVITLERDQALARAEAARAEMLRLALWRLDSWMAPRLAAEAARPYFHYLALYPPRRAYDQFLSPIAAGEVLTPSPLVGFRDDVVRLHVQVDASGQVTSPQAPEAASWNAQLDALVAEERRGEVSRLLEQAREDLGGLPLVRRVEEVVACQTMAIADDPQSASPFVNDLLDKLNNRGPTQWVAPGTTGMLASAGAGASSRSSGEVGTMVVLEAPPMLVAGDATLADAAKAAAKEREKADGAGTRAAKQATDQPVREQAAGFDRGPATDARLLADAARNATAVKAAPGARTKGEAESAGDGAPRAARSSERQTRSQGSAASPGASPSPSSAQTQSAGQPLPQAQSRTADNDYAKRLIQSSAAQVGAPVQVEAGLGEPTVEVGPFVPLWVAHGQRGPGLYYFRRVAVGSAELAQGFLVDWPTLAESLRQQVEDLLPNAVLEPVGLPEHDGLSSSVPTAHEPAAIETRLASIPARLLPGPCDPAAMPSGLTPARATLGAAWLALLAAIVAAGFSLRAVAADAARRTRFAGVVTHELRTPLTTFQLYTDMLVDGMVPAESRGEYLRTLRDESHRLGHLVENVLSYARIEQGGHTARLEDVTAAELVARVEQPLRRRAEAAGFEFRVESEVAEPGRRFHVDVDSVERILFNLVDNAAKYAAKYAGHGQAAGRPGEEASSDSAALVLQVAEVDGMLQLAVVDHGPGVPAPQQTRLFQPFERGSDDHTQQQRGIGLGLALSRELARALGGDLRHEPTPGGGATFRLSVR